MRSYLIILSLLVISNYSQSQKSITKVNIENQVLNSLRSSSQKSSLCINIMIDAPDLNKIEDLVCEYYKGHAEVTQVENLLLAYTVEADYEVYRKKPLDELRLQDDTFSMGIHVYYWIDGKVWNTLEPLPLGGSCGWNDEDIRELIIGWDSKITFSPDYYLRAATNLRPINDVNRCKVTLQDRDVTENINVLVKRLMLKASTFFEERVSKYSNFKPLVNKIWDSLQTPIQVNPNVWLSLHLRSISFGDIKTPMPNKISINLGVEFYPELVSGSKPPKDTTSLPPLGTSNCSPSFIIKPVMLTSLDSLNAIMNDTSKGIRLKYFDEGKKRIILGKARVAKNKDKIRFEIKTYVRPIIERSSPEIKKRNTIIDHNLGTSQSMFLVGRPEFDSATKDIYFPDLTFDPKTLKRLSKKEKWILKTPMLQTIKDRLRIHLTDRLDDFRNKLDSSSNRHIDDNLAMDGTFTVANLDTIFIHKKYIVTRFVVHGNHVLRSEER